MANEPVYVTFEFRGDLDKEVEKVTLGIKGLREESSKTFQRLAADSGAAYNAMNAESRKMAVTIQENIQSIRELDTVQKSLDAELENGSITTEQYNRVKAALAIQEENLRRAVTEGMQALNARTQSEREASDSVVSLTKKLQELTTTYYNMSKADREGAAGRGVLQQIGEVDKEVRQAQDRLSAYSRSAGTGFNSLSMSVQQVARELPSLTMGANMFFLAISNNLPILADNIQNARREYEAMTKAGQQATPVWKQVLSSIVSWQTALVVGITLLSVYGKEIIEWTKSLFGAKKSLADTLETLEEFQKNVSETSATTIAELQRMATGWDALGDNLKAKEQYILENKAAFDKLGVSVTDVQDAENLFVAGKDKFVESILSRAKAAAAMDMASEQYKKAIQKMLEADAMPDEQTIWIQNGMFGGMTAIQGENTAKKDRRQEAENLFAEGDKLIRKYSEYKKEEQAKLKEINVETTDAIVEGSVAAIKQSIALKEEALNKITNKADYDKALKEIEAEKKRLEAITGKQDGGQKKDDPAPLGSLRYYDELIAKTRKLKENATTDEARKQFDDQIKGYEKKVKEIQNRIILSGKNVAVETLQAVMKGLDKETLHGQFDTRMDIEKEFGDLDTSDLERLNDKIKETGTRAEDARRGIMRLIEEWDNLDSSDKALRIGNECYKIADGLSYASEMAGLFDEGLGSALETASNLVAGVGDIAGGIGRAMSGDIIGGASGIIGGITGIIGSFKKRVEENKKILAEYQLSLVETAMKELEYNAILRERLRLTQQIGESSAAYFARQSVELKKQSGDISKEYAEVWKKLQDEQYITATHYRHGTWFRKAKTWNDYGSLAGMTYEQIESLYTQDKLTDSAKVLFEQLQKLKEEGEDVAGMIDDLNEEMREAFTGTTVDSIADSILQGFAEGKRSAKDFADDFEEMLNNAVLQGVKMRALEEPLRQWYESFAAASENGLTADSIASLKAQYDRIIADAAKQLEDMEKVTGLTIGQSESVRTSVEKGIASSMNQESADELNGNFYALLIYADKTAQGVTGIRDSLVQGITLLERIAKNTDRLETIEKDISTMRSGFQDIINRGLILRKTA